MRPAPAAAPAWPCRGAVRPPPAAAAWRGLPPCSTQDQRRGDSWGLKGCTWDPRLLRTGGQMQAARVPLSLLAPCSCVQSLQAPTFPAACGAATSRPGSQPAPSAAARRRSRPCGVGDTRPPFVAGAAHKLLALQGCPPHSSQSARGTENPTLRPKPPVPTCLPVQQHDERGPVPLLRHRNQQVLHIWVGSCRARGRGAWAGWRLGELGRERQLRSGSRMP